MLNTVPSTLILIILSKSGIYKINHFIISIIPCISDKDLHNDSAKKSLVLKTNIKKKNYIF